MAKIATKRVDLLRVLSGWIDAVEGKMPASEVFVDIYADHGCSYAPSCLTCPFDVCRYDRGFAGNRVSKAINRVSRDQEILAMRASGMQVEQIARKRGISGRTVARILSRSGPSQSDEQIVTDHDSNTRQIATTRRTRHQDSLLAMEVRQRPAWPVPEGHLAGSQGEASVSPVRRIFSSV